ncbi:Uncharacterised protein [Mycobacterium tuberculosis]|nr:Uncharacterised protein [Mycobacterium tuberculosis]
MASWSSSTELALLNCPWPVVKFMSAFLRAGFASQALFTHLLLSQLESILEMVRN